jgi:NitT/TauT family transport system substrate-binding protein
LPGSLSLAGQFVGLERGYYREEGIDLEETPMDTSAKMLPALAAGQVDIAVGGVSAGLFNAIAQGIAVRAVLDSTSAYPNDSAGGLIVRKDLVDSGQVRDLRDLNGLHVAVTSKGQATELALYHALSQGGLTMGDVDITEMGYPDMTLALGNRNIDAAISIEPFVTLAVQPGFATRLKNWGELIPNDTMAMLMYSEAFATGNNDAGRRYARAYLRGVRDYHEARTRGRDRDAIVAILQQYTTLRDRAVFDQMQWLPIDPNGRVNPVTLAAAQDWFAERGYVPSKVDIAKVVDTQFADAAVAQLGLHQQ